MPTIEMHGFSADGGLAMKRRIRDEMSSSVWYERVVISNMNSTVTGAIGRRAPFLRVYAEPRFYRTWEGELEVHLRRLGIKYELAHLRKYVDPKQL